MNRRCVILISTLLLSIGGLPNCQAQSQRQPTVQKSPAQKPPAQTNTPLTWAQFVQQGGNSTIQFDYDLPDEFRNGRVYFNTQKERVSAFILKQGLSRYPPVKDGLIQLDYEYIPLYDSRGQMIALSWELGDVAAKHRNDTRVRYPFVNRNGACLRNVCLLASMLSRAELGRILRSPHPIKTELHQQGL